MKTQNRRRTKVGNNISILEAEIEELKSKQSKSRTSEDEEPAVIEEDNV